MVFRGFIILFLLGVCIVSVSAGAEALPPLGIAVLLDESDSMEENDPGRVRLQAANLFARLLGGAGEIIVLGFSGTTRELPLEEAGLPRSASRALPSAKTSKRAGQYSNIERAIRRARDELLQQDFKTAKPRRAILLVTDGQVDLGDAKADRISRESLRGPVAADLIEKGIEVYAIAFSVQADHKLLEYLTRMTGGFCLTANQINELPELFTRIYEELAEIQSIPLRGGQALVDGEVREATFLIPRLRATRQTHLVRPDGSRINREIHGEGTRWEVLPGYDLVQMSQPMAGLWNVEPMPEETVPRLMVQSDLTVRPRNVPKVMVAGQANPVSVDLAGDKSAGGQRVQAILDGRKEQVWTLRAEGGGAFGARIVPPSETGSFDLELLAEGDGFQRRAVRRVAVAPRWFQVQLDRDTTRPGEMVRLTASLDGNNAWLPAAMRFEASVAGPDGNEKSLPMQTRDNGRTYTAALDGLKQAGDYRISVAGRVLRAGEVVGQAQVGPLDLMVRESIVGPPLLALPPLSAALDGTAGAGSSNTLQVGQTGANDMDRTPLAKRSSSVFYWVQGGILALIALVAVLLAIMIARRPMGSPGRQRVFSQPVVPAMPPVTEKSAERAPNTRSYTAEMSEQPPLEAQPLLFVPEVLVEATSASGSNSARAGAAGISPNSDGTTEEASIGLTEEEADILQGMMREGMAGAEAPENEERIVMETATEAEKESQAQAGTSAPAESMESLFAKPASDTSVEEEIPSFVKPPGALELDAPDSEENLLAELARMEVPIPDIPEELDERSDQDVIDDILRQIESRRP